MEGRAFPRPADYAAACLVFFLLAIPFAGILRCIDCLRPNVDFFAVAASHEFVRRTILDHWTIPLWSHFFGGGYPTFSHPDDPSLSPFVLLTLLFGTVLGLKVIVFLGQLIGAFSTYLFARLILGYNAWGSLFASIVFGVGPWLPVQISGGNYTEIYVYFIPLCLLLVGLALRGSKLAFVLLPLVIYTMAYDGKTMSVFALAYVGLVCLMEVVYPSPVLRTRHGSSRTTDTRPLALFALVVVFGAVLASVKILPVLDLLLSRGGLGQIDVIGHPRAYGLQGISPYSLGSLTKELVGWKLGHASIGPIPLVLFVTGSVVLWRPALPWLTALMLFAWLSLGYNAPIDALGLLWTFPLFNTITWPVKYFSGQIVFSMAVVGASVFGLLEERLGGGSRRFVAASAIILVASLGLYPYVAGLQLTTYSLKPWNRLLAQTTDSEFFTVRGRDLPRIRYWPAGANQYLNLLQNVGTIDWYNSLLLPEHAVPRYLVDPANRRIPNSDYRGEVFYFESGNRASLTFLANTIVANVTAVVPGTLVINQNFSRHWQADRGQVISVTGLLAVRLEDVGTYEVRLRYRPPSFRLGLVVTALSAVAFGVFCSTYVRKRGVPFGAPPNPAEPEPNRTGSGG